VNQEARKVGICDDLLVQVVATFGVDAVRAIPESVVDGLQPAVAFKIVDLIMDERLAIGDQELKVPELRTVNSGPVALRYDSFPKGEPELGGSGVSRADAIFGTTCPAGFHAWVAEGVSCAA
jgi:hypothetical protein